MKRILLSSCLFFTLLVNTSAQVADNSKPFIEVTGTSETEITPDEIYITITLLERMENKEKVTIDKQESALKQNLKELGIDISNLTLNSADVDYSKIRKSTKDVLISKSYILKINGADMLSKVYERLDRINAFDAYISKLTHSKILDYTKENRIKAIKAAKEKVDYVLAAAGKQSGIVLQISETDNSVIHPFYTMNYKSTRASNAVQAYATADGIDGASEDISIKKIKITSSFLVKYEILNK